MRVANAHGRLLFGWLALVSGGQQQARRYLQFAAQGSSKIAEAAKAQLASMSQG